MSVRAHRSSFVAAFIAARFDLEKLSDDAKHAGLDNLDHRPYCLRCNSMSRMTPIGSDWVCDLTQSDYARRFGCGARTQIKDAAP